MPSTITHEYHYRDTYAKTTKNFKDTYPYKFYSQYSLGAQGHDAYLFLDFWNPFIFKKNRDEQALLFDEHFQDLIVNLSRAIIEKGKTRDKEVKLILYGYIMHHILDAYLHPYIDYESEREFLHPALESYFDEYMMEKRENKSSNKCKPHKLIPPLPEISDSTKDILSTVFKDTYGIVDFGHHYIRALKQIRTFLMLFRYDPVGLKKTGYKLIDRFHISKDSFYWLSYANRYDSFEIYLNNSHSLWLNPKDGTPNTTSFEELYESAVRASAETISSLEELIVNRASDIEIKNAVPRISADPKIENGRHIELAYLK